jgi:hypothetical protein
MHLYPQWSLHPAAFTLGRVACTATLSGIGKRFLLSGTTGKSPLLPLVGSMASNLLWWVHKPRKIRSPCLLLDGGRHCTASSFSEPVVTLSGKKVCPWNGISFWNSWHISWCSLRRAAGNFWNSINRLSSGSWKFFAPVYNCILVPCRTIHA